MMLRKCIEEGGGKGASEWVVGGGGGWEGLREGSWCLLLSPGP